MNKKCFAMLLLSAVLGLGSCNEIQDLNMSFGNRTFINDYNNLINQINNLTLTVKDRFNALSDMLQKGMNDIKVSVDANTGAITVLSQNVATMDENLKENLSTINTTLFNGFNSVCTQIDATGKTIVAAIDSNGNLLRLKIDETGKLLAAQILTSTDELIKVMKESTTTLAEKLGLIDASLLAGFADQKAAQNAVTAAINTLKDKTISGSDINAALDEIKKAISDDGVSISAKLTAIEAANNAGLSTIAENTGLINSAIGTLTNQVRSGITSITTALGQIKSAISNDQISLASKIEMVQQAITTGFTDLNGANGANGALQTMTEALKTAIEGVSSKLTFGEGSDAKSVARYLSEMVGSLNNIKDKMETTNTKLEGIRALIEKELADNGVTFSEDKKSLLVIPEIWGMIENAGQASQLYQVFLSAIEDSTPTQIANEQIRVNAIFWHGGVNDHIDRSNAPNELAINYDFNPESMSLQSSGLNTQDNGKKIITVIKIKTEINLKVAFQDFDRCSYPYLHSIRVSDVRGEYQEYGKQIGARSEITVTDQINFPDTKIAETTIRIVWHNTTNIISSVETHFSSMVFKILIHNRSKDEVGQDYNFKDSQMKWPSDFTDWWYWSGSEWKKYE